MEPNDLRHFTTPKRFHSSIEYDGSIVEIEIETPDLSGVTPSMWGDWGPMYTFEFDEPRAVRIITRYAGGIEDESELWLTKVRLDSPMRHARRQEHPLFLRFQHQELGLEFEGYLDEWGVPAALEVKQTSLGDNVLSRLLWQPPRIPEYRKTSAGLHLV